MPPSTLVYLNQPRALFFDKLVSVVAIFSYQNYWIASVYFSLLSLALVPQLVKLKALIVSFATILD